MYITVSEPGFYIDTARCARNYEPSFREQQHQGSTAAAPETLLRNRTFVLESRSYLCTLGLKVGVIKTSGALGKGHGPKLQ